MFETFNIAKDLTLVDNTVHYNTIQYNTIILLTLPMGCPELITLTQATLSFAVPYQPFIVTCVHWVGGAVFMILCSTRSWVSIKKYACVWHDYMIMQYQVLFIDAA